MTLAEFRLRIGQTLNLATSSAHNERDLVDSWVNEGIVKVLTATKVNKKTAQVQLTADKGDYTLDPVMLSFDDIWIEPTPNSGYQPMLEFIDSYDIRAMRNASSPAVASPPSYISFEGNTIFLYPNPSSGDVMHIVYVPRPTPLTDEDHDPSIAPFGEIPAEWHDVIEAYAKWKAADYADDASSQVGQAYKAEYESGVIGMKVNLTKKAGVRIGHARVGRRRTTRLAPPGVDIRG